MSYYGAYGYLQLSEPQFLPMNSIVRIRTISTNKYVMLV